MNCSRITPLRFGSLGGYGAVLVLGIIVVVLLPIGERARLIEMPYPVGSFTSLLDESGRRIAVALAWDDVFVILYLCFFFGLTELTREHAGALAWSGLASGLATGGFDLWENARLLGMIESVSAGARVGQHEADLTYVIAQLKFCCSYLALFFFSAGVWREGRLGRLLAVMFVVFAVLGPFAFVNDLVSLARIPLMALGFALGGLLLGRAARAR